MQSAALFTRIGTRGSPLALYQANLVRRLLSEAHGVAEAEIEIVVITTSGDRLTDRPLSEAGGKGLFTKEIETALIEGRIDIGVHSCKDVATIWPKGLLLAAVLEREDVRDAFVSLSVQSIDQLPQGAKLGTSSIRRAAQMLRYRPDLLIVPFRGNIDTRLKKLSQGVADATLLAAAGLNRLDRPDRITAHLDPLSFPPAPAQGAIVVQIRKADGRSAQIVGPLNHEPTSTAIRAERAMLAAIEGSCRTPVGVFTRMTGNEIELCGELLSPDGKSSFKDEVTSSLDQPEIAGRLLGERLLELAGPGFLAHWGM